MNAFFVLLVLVVIALLVPVKYDPAFWLKDWAERRRKP